MSLDSTSELNTLELPAIGHASTQNSKRSSMKKRLSRIAISLSSNDVQPPSDYNSDNLSFPYDDSNELNNEYNHNRVTSSLPDQSSHFSPLSKHNASTSNLTNTTSISNPKFFSKATRSSSSSSSSIKSISPQLPNPNVLSPQPTLPISRTSSFGNFTNPISSKQAPNHNSNNNSNHHTYSSPSKINARSLATNNDHTFLLTNNSNYSLQLPTTSHLKQKSHSATPSISNSIAPETLSRSIPASSLPQFTSINPSNNTVYPVFNSNSNPNTNGVLAPPTVLAPIYKTPSSNSQTTSQQSTTSTSISTNSTSITNNYNTMPISSASDSIKHKRGAGLLQSAYKTSHHPSHSNLQNNISSKTKEKQDYLDDDDKEEYSKYGSVYTSDISLNQSRTAINSSQYALSNINNSKSSDNLQSINDLKFHLVSPKIINEFHSLQRSIQIGMKKRLEFLDKENGSLIADINTAYDKLNNIQLRLASQVQDLDKYIEELSLKKETDVKNLLQDILFENLNDLTVRIDTVKENMATNKDTIKTFDNRLKTLDKMRSKNEARNKNLQQSFIMVSGIVVCFFLIKWYVF